MPIVIISLSVNHLSVQKHSKHCWSRDFQFTVYGCWFEKFRIRRIYFKNMSSLRFGWQKYSVRVEKDYLKSASVTKKKLLWQNWKLLTVTSLLSRVLLSKTMTLTSEKCTGGKNFKIKAYHPIMYGKVAKSRCPKRTDMSKLNMEW